MPTLQNLAAGRGAIVKNISSGSWTGERVELLTKLWAAGLSASQVASELGGITRNSVISKIHRLGLSGRAKGHNRASSLSLLPRGTSQRRTRPSAPQGVSSAASESRRAERQRLPSGVLLPREEEPELIEISVEQRRTLLQLNERNCHWPVGTPGTDGFYFCGADANDAPYCAHHCRVAHQPAAERRHKIGRIYRSPPKF